MVKEVFVCQKRMSLDKDKSPSLTLPNYMVGNTHI